MLNSPFIVAFCWFVFAAALYWLRKHKFPKVGLGFACVAAVGTGLFGFFELLPTDSFALQWSFFLLLTTVQAALLWRPPFWLRALLPNAKQALVGSKATVMAPGLRVKKQGVVRVSGVLHPAILQAKKAAARLPENSLVVVVAAQKNGVLVVEALEEESVNI